MAGGLVAVLGLVLVPLPGPGVLLLPLAAALLLLAGLVASVQRLGRSSRARGVAAGGGPGRS